MILAKFHVNEIKEFSWGTEVTMTPVYSDNPESENKRFWEATPNGTLRMTIKNQAAADYFKRDGEYYIDFSEASS